MDPTRSTCSESMMVNPPQKDRSENHRQRTKTRQRCGHVGFLVQRKTQFCEMQNTVAVERKFDHSQEPVLQFHHEFELATLHMKIC